MLAPGGVRDGELRALLEANEEEVARVRDFFFQLGHRLTLKHDALTLKHDSESQKRALESKDSQLAASGIELEALRDQVREREEREWNFDGLAGPAFKLQPATDPGYLDYAVVARNYSAVTGACMLTRRELFLRMGGFDEARFAVTYYDVDYGHRLVRAGHRIVYCPTAELIQHGGGFRGSADPLVEQAAFRKQWGGWRDPCYNPKPLARP